MTHRFLFVGTLAAGAALRLWGLGRESLWHDESWTWYLVHDSLGDLFRRLVREDAHPPLYFVLLWPWAKLGDSEAMLRLPSALLGIASLPLAYRLARSLAGVREGLVAMAFLAVSPFHVRYSQEARSYALLFFLCLLSLILLIELRRSPRDRRLWAAMAAVTAAVVYTEYLGLFFILGEIALVVAWGRGDRPFAARCFKAAAAAFVLFLPWAPAAWGHVTQVGDGFWLPKPVPAVMGMEFSRLFVYPHGITATMEIAGNLFGALLALAAAVPAIGTLALALGAPRLARRSELVPWAWAAALPPLLQVVAGCFISIFCARGLIFVLAPLLALAAVGATSLPRALGRIGVAAVLLSALPGLASIHGALQKEDWRAATAFLKERAAPGDLVLVHEGFLDVNLRYYWRDRGSVRVAAVGDDPAEAATRARLQPQVWLVRRAYPERTDPPKFLEGTFLSRLWHVRQTWKPRAELLDSLSDAFPLHEEWRWRDVGILRFNR